MMHFARVGAFVGLFSLLGAATAAAADIPPGTAAGVVDIILEKGITGALLIVMMIACYRLYTELKIAHADALQERASRVEDAKMFGDKMVLLQERVVTASNRLIAMADREETRQKEQQLVEAATGARPPFRGRRISQMDPSELEDLPEDTEPPPPERRPRTR